MKMHYAESAPRASDIPLARAAQVPDRPALLASERVVTYIELAILIRSAAAVLTRAGVTQADRVVVTGLNSIELAAFVFAAQQVDAWPAILNPRLSAAEVDANIALIEPKVIVFIAADGEEAQAHAKRYDVRDSPEFSGVLVANGDPRPEQIPRTPAESRPGALLFTSGSTGKPRAVVLSSRALIAIGTSTAQNFCDDDVTYAIAPFTHIIGLGSVLMGSMCAGAAIDLAPRFDLPGLAEAIRSGRITRIIAVPLIYSKLLDYLSAYDIDIRGHRLRALASGGAPLNALLKSRVEQRFGIGLMNGYGCTEISPIARSESQVGEGTHVGKPFGAIELRLVNEGSDVADGEIGEIWVRGPNLMDGYFRDPEATAAVQRPGGWLATGDLGRRDAAGNLEIVGRSKELIIRSGFNVYPAEIEAVLSVHPAVQLVAVVGRSVADGNEEVIAFVQPQPHMQVSPAEIKGFAAQRLTPYKKPSRVVLLAQLPVGATGKIDKRELRRLAAAL